MKKNLFALFLLVSFALILTILHILVDGARNIIEDHKDSTKTEVPILEYNVEEERNWHTEDESTKMDEQYERIMQRINKEGAWDDMSSASTSEPI